MIKLSGSVNSVKFLDQLNNYNLPKNLFTWIELLCLVSYTEATERNMKSGGDEALEVSPTLPTVLFPFSSLWPTTFSPKLLSLEKAMT
jgi:hypothetical protein